MSEKEKDVATYFKQGFDRSGNIQTYPDLSNVNLTVGNNSRPAPPEPPPCRVIKDPSFWGIFSKGE